MSNQKFARSIWLLSLSLWLLCILGNQRASAQQTGVVAPPNTKAQQHLVSGREALAKGDLSRAQAELEQAYRLGVGPEVLGLLGKVALQQGLRTQAADLLRRYLTEVSVAPGEAAPLQTLIQSEQESAAEVVVSGAAGSLLRADARIVGRLPLSRLLLMTPGPHRLVLETEGRSREHLVKAASGIPVSVRFVEDSGSSVDAFETRPPVVLLVYEQQLQLPSLPLNRAILDRVRLDGQAYDLAPERAERELRNERAGCLGDTACVLRLARKLGCDYVLQVAKSGADYSVQLRDLAVDLSAAASQVAVCSGRSEASCASALRDVVGELLTPSLSRQHGRLRITTKPERATVAIDDQPLPFRSPQEVSLFAGEHKVTLSQPGFLTQRAEVSVAADSLTERLFELQVDVAAQRQRRLAIGKRVLAVTGALAIVGGVVAIGLNGIQRSDASDPTHYQELLSWPHGVAAISVGAISAGLAVWLYRKEKAAAQEVQTEAR